MPPVISDAKPAMACGLTPQQVMQTHPFVRLQSLPDILTGKSARTRHAADMHSDTRGHAADTRLVRARRVRRALVAQRTGLTAAVTRPDPRG